MWSRGALVSQARRDRAAGKRSERRALELGFSFMRGSDHLTTPLRRPQRTRADAKTMTIPTDMKPAVTRDSCQGSPLWPTPVIGERAAVPKIAASRVTNQFT